MLIESDSEACRLLEQVNYYRLSGYWYSWRKLLEPEKRADSFIEGTTLVDVAAVYMFDCRLRETVFACLAPIELSVRSMLGHELGHVAPFAHLHPNVLGPLAQASDGEGSSAGYQKWLARYEKELRASREDFVAHHKNKYGGRLPIWAAVEVITNRFLLWTLLDPVQAIREWLRVLRPGGLLFCADANHFPHGINTQIKVDSEGGPDEFTHVYNPDLQGQLPLALEKSMEAYLRCFEEAGATDIQINPVDGVAEIDRNCGLPAGHELIRHYVITALRPR